MPRTATKLIVKQNYEELAQLVPKVEALVSADGFNVTNILCIVSYDQYCGLYNNPKTRHLPINIVRLNNFRSGTDFVESYSKALRDCVEGTLVVIDDVRDFLQQGRIYAPGRLTQSLHLLEHYGSDIFKLYGGSGKAISELEAILSN